MTIKYSDGRSVEAVLLSRSDNAMRLAVQGSDDVQEYLNFHGTWVSPDCEPVTIQFAWQRQDRLPTVTEAECACSHELAARLLRMLFSGSENPKIELEAHAETPQPTLRVF